MAGDVEVAKAFLLLSRHPDFRVIRRMPQWREPVSLHGDEIKTAVYVDVETTGTDPRVDEVIELSMLPFTYGKNTGVISNVFAPFHGFNEPSIPIPPEITKLTGITNEMVKGHKLNADEIEVFVSPFNLVVSHHAEFDRKFCEKVCPEFKNLHWACSESQVPWREAGINGTKLEYIAYRLGWFYDGHRSENDCLAGVTVLSALLQDIGKTGMQAMIENARKKQIHLWATEAPFDNTPLLKKRGYFWSPGGDGRYKAWHKCVDIESVDAEIKWVSDNVYGRAPGDLLKMNTVTSLNRFSERE